MEELAPVSVIACTSSSEVVALLSSIGMGELTIRSLTSFNRVDHCAMLVPGPTLLARHTESKVVVRMSGNSAILREENNLGGGESIQRI